MKTGVADWPRADALEALAWLVAAGADTAVSDTPSSWLRQPEALTAQPIAEAVPEQPRPTPAAAPAGAGSLPEPVMEGPPTAPLLLVMEADARAASGRILIDQEQLLLKRMLAAIGIDVEQTARLGQRGGTAPSLAATGARAVLLLGDRPSRDLIGKPAAAARGQLHQLDGIAAVVTFAPAFLISQPRMKALAWADLRLFARHLASMGLQ